MDNRQSIYQSQAHNPFLVVQLHSVSMQIISLFMFGSPAVHAGRLRGVIVDGGINANGLEKYVQSMVTEWGDVALYVRTTLLPSRVQ